MRKYETFCREKEGIVHKFYEQTEKGTGRCAVCIVDKDRSMVADLLCNELFPQEEPDFLFDDCKSLWQNAEICYISGILALLLISQYSFVKEGVSEHN